MEKVLINAMLSKIQKDIKKHENELEKLKEIDLKHCKINVEIEKFLEIIEAYKKVELNNKEEKFLVLCNGNPYIVLNLAIISILNNINMSIDIDNTMLGVNTCILKIINNVVKENNLELKIVQNIEEKNKIICIDRINEYNILKKRYKDIKYISYKSIDIYSESDEFEELFEKVYRYAIDMNIDVDIFDEEGIEGLFKYGKGRIKLILTRNKDLLKYKRKNIYINENPFKEEKVLFDKEIIESIFDKNS